ncbi:uncharacterized protein LOC125660446 [Ostrea edulis]|uniref:uncharacterized protein LOC130046600 n=1 Tax=Ostrea edulis TaxID=37623 RepID=UPI0024AE94DD|nr:uncharacterized protein LOC130046600 [Ostrea edulis]XP_056006321.1 uncharacterized protein LOC125660446 [Ostrea edulis]
MMCIIRFYLVVLLNSLFVISLAQIYNPGVCSNEDEPLQCCLNYKIRGDSCEECWPGTFGIDCEDCPEGFYGRFCIEVCNCSSCDKVSGCQPNSTQTDKDINFISDNSNNESVIIGSSLAGSLTFIIVIVIYCKKSRNRTLMTPDSFIQKGGLQVSTIPLNRFPQLSPSSSNEANSGDPESTFHGGKFEPLEPQMCCQQNDFTDNSISSKENSHAKLLSSDSVYCHMNMEVDHYDIIDLPFDSSQETDEDFYSPHSSNSCCNNTDSGCSSKNSENGSLLSVKQCSETLNKNSQTADIFGTHDIREIGHFKTGMMKKNGISSVKVKIEAMHLEELSRKLRNFQQYPEDTEFNDLV